MKQNSFFSKTQKHFSGFSFPHNATKLLLFSTFAVIILFISCQKELTIDGSDLAKNGINDTRNKVSLEEAQAAYKEVLATKSFSSSEPNPNDLMPQWNEAGSYNFADTAGNYLSVPSAVFTGGGYKKLIFFRNNGQVTFVLATILAEAEYINRKNGVCTMEDFDGIIYYKNTQGVATGGFVLHNGNIVKLLIPNNRPRPEFDADNIFDAVVITASRSGGGGPFRLILPTYNIYSMFTSNGFTGSANNGSDGSGGSSNDSYNASAGPVVTGNSRICPNSFNFKSDSTAGPNGTRLPGNSTINTCGLRNVAIDVTFTNYKGEVVTMRSTMAYLHVQMPSQCGLALGELASAAMQNAINDVQNELQGRPNPPLSRIDERLFLRFNDNLRLQDEANCAAANSPTNSNAIKTSSGSLLDYSLRGLQFNDYTICF